MTFSAEQLLANQKKSAESLLGLADKFFDSAERLAQLNIQTARSVLQGSSDYLRQALDTQDASGFAALQAAQPREAATQVLSYCQHVRSLSAETQEEFASLVEAQLASIQSTIGTVLDQVAKNGPAGSDAAVDAVKSAVTAANLAYDTLNKTVKQVTDASDARFQAVADAAAHAFEVEKAA